jgi:hypothetical protein
LRGHRNTMLSTALRTVALGALFAIANCGPENEAPAGSVVFTYSLDSKLTYCATCNKKGPAYGLQLTGVVRNETPAALVFRSGSEVSIANGMRQASGTGSVRLGVDSYPSDNVSSNTAFTVGAIIATERDSDVETAFANGDRIERRGSIAFETSQGRLLMPFTLAVTDR